MQIFDTKVSQSSKLADIYFLSCDTSDRNLGNNCGTIKLASTILLAFTLTANAPATYSINNSFPAKNLSGQNIELVANANTARVQDLEIKVQKIHRLESSPSVERSLNKLYGKLSRVQMLMNAFEKNHNQKEQIPFDSYLFMHSVNMKLSELEFNDAILQYDGIDDVLEYNLFFKHNIELSIGAYPDGAGEIDYSIFHNGELIISDISTLGRIITKFTSVLGKIGSYA